MMDYDTEKEMKFSLDTALKHHSSTQAAIKTLQEQLEHLEELRTSTKEASFLKEEKELEDSAVDLLSSTQRFLLDSPQIRTTFPLLSSTLNAHETKTDETVTRNLLPSLEFERIRNKDSVVDFFSPIKSLNHVENAARENPESGTSPSNPLLPSHLSSPAMSARTPKSSSNFAQPAQNHRKPTRGNLTEILSRIAHGSTFNSSTDESTDNSDELITVLEKIARAGQELQTELQNSKARETRLIEEIYRLRSKKNGFSTHHHSDESFSDAAAKCRKLEDAMLSLQDENLKLNKLLKERRCEQVDENESKRILIATQSENRLLQATVDRMKAQLAYYEERNSRHSSSAQTSPSLRNQTAQDSKVEAINEKRLLLEERMKYLEQEVNTSRASNNKDLQTRIGEMHDSLTQKNNHINRCESELQSTRMKNKELNEKYEMLQQKDVFKRKEVLLLCEKFERMKEKYLELEEEVVNLRKSREEPKKSNDERGRTRKSAEESLRRFLQENEVLHRRLVADQREISQSKTTLENDYVTLKERYDSLLVSLTGAEKNSRKSSSKSRGREINKENVSSHPCQHCSLRQNSALENGLSSPEKSHKPQHIQTNLNHKRHHTAPENHPSLNRLSRTTPEVRSYFDRKTRRNSFSHPKSSKDDVVSSGYASRVPQPRAGSSFFSQSENFDGALPLCSCGAFPNLKRTPELSHYITMTNTEVPMPSDECFGIPNKEFARDVNRRSRVFKDEYARNMGSSLRSKSCDQLLSKDVAHPDTLESSPLRSRSEVLSASTISPQRKRVLTAPGVLASSFSASPASTNTPYANEYLSNMNGVRLLVSLEDRNNNSAVFSKRSSNGLPHNFTYEPARLTANETIVSQSSTLEKSPTTFNVSNSILPPLLSSNFELDSTTLGDSCSESTSSLHLSSLPCDQASVVDKFRNFDDYKQPPALRVEDGSEPLLPTKEKVFEKKTSKKKEKASESAVKKKQKIAKQEAKKTSGKNEKSSTRIEESQAIEQSSVSTTLDHVGRIEFLRDIQINSGMRLPGVLADVSIRDAVVLNESELNGDVKLGLSDNQEAYAEKLVKKYTKNAGKIMKDFAI